MSALALRCSEVGSVAPPRHKRTASLLNLLPRLVRIVGGHRLGQTGRIRAQVLLIDLAILVHDKGHHAGVAILRRVREKRKATRHLFVVHVVFRAALSRRSLAGERAEIVTLIGRALRLRATISLPGRGGNQRSNGAGVALTGIPVKAVLRARSAEKLGGVLPFRSRRANLALVLNLRAYQRAHGFDGAQFVLPNPPVEKLFFAAGRIKKPGTVSLHYRNRQGPA